MLLPLPALPSAQPTGTGPDNGIADNSSLTDEPSADISSPTDTPDNNDTSSPAEEASFKILTGDTVTELTCREFLIRTLAFEMSPTYHAEALKAQAVAAYTYYGRRQRAQATEADPALKGAHFKAPDDTFPQDYTTDKLRERWGDKYDTYYNKLCAAVDEVIGKHITYNNEWIDACFFAISNGSTESAKTVWGADVPYLQAVASPGDKLAPAYESVVTMTAEQAKTALTASDAALTLGDDPTAWFGQTTLSAAGTVTSLPVGGKTLTGTAVRSALGLRSASFSVAFAHGSFRFTVHGYGHGVGMSQYGADYLARQGYNWQEILQYYYTGVKIS
jgi:stage II sporulation protein D